VAKKTAVMEWIDDQLKANPRLAREVDETLNEMRLEQDLTALREKRKLSQRQVAKLLGTSQPYVAKLESGRVKNVGGDRESIAVATNPKFLAIIERSRALHKPGMGISTEEMRRRLALKRRR
jgi:DNA-binding transcriptional regulator YiaG